MQLVPLVAGVILGGLLVKERRARHAAQRLGAAALETLLNAIDANDPQTGAHVRRVASYSLVIADAAGAGSQLRSAVERTALFHDIGKIHQALFDIIHDDEKLTEAERTAIRSHPELGARVLAPLLAFYPELGEAVMSHHERWDGTGYPAGLARRRIPIASRIVAIADAFDAMTHDRRYRTARGAQHAADALAEGRGTQFDPDLIDLALLPPVWNQLLSTHTRAHRRRTDEDRRENGTVEREAPEVTFRWRGGVSPAAAAGTDS